MKKKLFLFLLTSTLTASAQQVLTLEECRELALRNNKQLSATHVKQEVAENLRKAARTKYLPKVDVVGGYEFFSREISLLSKDQRAEFSNLGTTAMGAIGERFPAMLTEMAMKGLITPEMAQQTGAIMGQIGQPIAQLGNQFGQKISDALKTDTKNIWAASAVLRQPIYMGGAITAANRMAEINKQLVANEELGAVQNTLKNIDDVYWTVVSLKQKQLLANSYRDLVQQLNSDVHKMIDEGIATRATGLQVDVKVNEAEMQVTQVENGLALSKMLLCQLCGLPIGSEITLADEGKTDLGENAETMQQVSGGSMTDVAFENRAELKMLQNVVDLSEQATKLVRAAYLPQVALTGGYLLSNPNLFNGFERKFAGVWNVGVMVRVPVWNWFEGVYKVRASRAATTIATIELDDAREKIELQLEQCRFKLKEAEKRLSMASKNLTSADENLRCANVGFREGVMEATDVMAAQTAWQLAQSQKIDAEVEVRLARVALNKALGTLQ
ncbi:MAG: TolC family protein [Prevotella sp.]|nr:TolC family protein [Prevotella sp.]